MGRYEQLITDMKAHAYEENPKECCGIITNNFEYVRAKNLSIDPENTFVLDPKILIEYDENCWGIFHSHPDEDFPYPSDGDKLGAVHSQYKFIVGYNMYFMYWVDQKNNLLLFDQFREEHLCK